MHFFCIFQSGEGDDLSPQYIPAEKYELERKAMYDNLLRPNTPDKDIETSTVNSIEESSTDILNGEEAQECDEKREMEVEECIEAIAETEPEKEEEEEQVKYMVSYCSLAV